MGCRHDYAINRITSAFSVQVRMSLVVTGEKNSSKKEMVFLFRSLSCKTMCIITAKQQKCRFLVLKRNIQNVAAGFALFTVVESSSFIG